MGFIPTRPRNVWKNQWGGQIASLKQAIRWLISIIGTRSSAPKTNEVCSTADPTGLSRGEKDSIRQSGSSPSRCTHAFRVPKRNTRENDFRSLLPQTVWKSSVGGLHHMLAVWLGRLQQNVALRHTRHPLFLKWNLQEVNRECQPWHDPLLASSSHLSPACFALPVLTSRGVRHSAVTASAHCPSALAGRRNQVAEETRQCCVVTYLATSRGFFVSC